MSDDTTKFVLDLDNSKFIASSNEALGALKQISNTDSMKELIEGLETAGIAVGALTAAFLVAKESLSLVMEAEGIKAVTAEFQVLTAQAGISGKALKESLESASGGLISETDLIKSANKALIQMGGLASNLGPIMDLARRQGALFGVDTTTAFEQINQAISTGQVRMLRHLGIVIDQKKAYEDYAASIGVVADELSKEGQQHAVLNAVMAKTSGLTTAQIEDIKKVTTSWEQLKVSLQELREIIVLVFEKTLGPLVAKAVSLLHGMVDAVHQVAIAFGGSDLQKAQQNMNGLAASIKNAETELTYLESKRASGGTPEFIKSMDESIDRVKAKITALKGQAEVVKQTIDSAEKKEESSSPGAGGESEIVKRDEIDHEKMKANRAKFYSDLAKLRAQSVDSDLKLADSEVKLNDATARKKLVIEEESAAAIKKIETDKSLHTQEKAQLIVQQKQATTAKLKQLDEDYKANYDRMLTNMVKDSQSASDGIEKAFRAGSLKAKQDLNDFGKTGTMVYDTFTSHSKSALMDLGKGSKDANDIEKELFFGMLADMAEQRGALILASSIWPPNPAGIAAGSGLLVLAGALSAMSGGTSSTGSSGYSTSSAGIDTTGIGDGGAATALDTTSPASASLTQTPTNVSIVVQGSYFETEQTKIALVDLIRQATDATDYSVNPVGGTG